MLFEIQYKLHLRWDTASDNNDYKNLNRKAKLITPTMHTSVKNTIPQVIGQTYQCKVQVIKSQVSYISVYKNTGHFLKSQVSLIHSASSGGVWKSRWTSWAPVLHKPTVSVDVKQHFNQIHDAGYTSLYAEEKLKLVGTHA